LNRQLGGVLIFRDPIGTGAVAIAGRMIAFGLVIAGLDRKSSVALSSGCRTRTGGAK
jgi:hypothetical protein